MERENLAKRLKELRALRGMSQEYLAEESRVGLRTIQRIENSESSPTGETIKRIANALEVELSELAAPGTITETSDMKATLVFLKMQLNKAHEKSEIRTFRKFIDVLEKLREKELNVEQLEAIESYLRYLELEKIPSFSNDIFRKKLTQFKKYLKNKLGFVPNHYYTLITAGFAISFGVSFVLSTSMMANIDITVQIAVVSVVGLSIVAGALIDSKYRKQNRSLYF